MVVLFEQWDKFGSKVLKLRKNLTELYIQLTDFLKANEHLNEIYGLLDASSEIYEDNLKTLVTLYAESILKAGSWLLMKSLMENTLNSGERIVSVELFLGEMWPVGFLITILIALAKEFYDLKVKEDKFNFYDIAATVIGSLLYLFIAARII